MFCLYEQAKVKIIMSISVKVMYSKQRRYKQELHIPQKIDYNAILVVVL